MAKSLERSIKKTIKSNVNSSWKKAETHSKAIKDVMSYLNDYFVLKGGTAEGVEFGNNYLQKLIKIKINKRYRDEYFQEAQKAYNKLCEDLKEK